MAPALPEIPSSGPRGQRQSGRQLDPRCPGILVLLPSGPEDGPMAIEAVRSGRSVLVNASRLERSAGQRLIDFTCGGVTAMDGVSRRIGDAVFLFAPAISRIESDPEQD